MRRSRTLSAVAAHGTGCPGALDTEHATGMPAQHAEPRVGSDHPAHLAPGGRAMAGREACCPSSTSSTPSSVSPWSSTSTAARTCR